MYPAMIGEDDSKLKERVVRESLGLVEGPMDAIKLLTMAIRDAEVNQKAMREKALEAEDMAARLRTGADLVGVQIAHYKHSIEILNDKLKEQ